MRLSTHRESKWKSVETTTERAEIHIRSTHGEILITSLNKRKNTSSLCWQTHSTTFIRASARYSYYKLFYFLARHTLSEEAHKTSFSAWNDLHTALEVVREIIRERRRKATKDGFKQSKKWKKDKLTNRKEIMSHAKNL